MRYFLDTEFIESGPEYPIELISIGIVSEDGREFYAENADLDASRAGDWVKENVLPNLFGEPLLTRKEIGEHVLRWIGVPSDKVSFWGYYADYDWVLFAQLFGTMVEIPGVLPKFCNDLKQLADMLGPVDFPEKPGGEHNALIDARWNADLFHALWERRERLMLDGVISI